MPRINTGVAIAACFSCAVLVRMALPVTQAPQNSAALSQPPGALEAPVTKESPMYYIYDVIPATVTVVDGDTVRAQLDLGFDIAYNADVRIRGVDTPETTRVLQRPAAAKAKGFVLQWFQSPGKKTCQSFSWDKYGGRVLGDFFDANGESLSAAVIKGGYGKTYTGEKKTPWTTEQLRAIEALP